ncbi:response regulator transcription factor [Amycolatopsis suaedae]|uniref:Response regulator transcription factor n=1 Tax=Amycolatopsis suaedae TaxID=2510978 RepID=A0A4Q7J3Y8_9PSEU|nr:response regulator transcription factor [Amycolatopsis suaedae]RZQ61508.1 response regulator transcription factor [Amycolatopsis suaedae]
MSDSAPIRVLLVDDDPMVLSGLTMILAGAQGIEVVGEARDGGEVPDAVSKQKPDVVLMDIRMQRVDGLRMTELLRSRPGAPEVIILTTFDADEHVLRALRAGASGFLVKDTPPGDIVRAIELVARGEAMLSPTVTKRLVTHVATGQRTAGDRARTLFARLTEREREVALAIAMGKSNADISKDLHMSLATVKTYVSRALAKVEANNRVQLALLAHDVGAAG